VSDRVRVLKIFYRLSFTLFEVRFPFPHAIGADFKKGAITCRISSDWTHLISSEWDHPISSQWDNRSEPL
jgi:hypothetical protein